jgi:hypothetical protein
VSPAGLINAIVLISLFQHLQSLFIFYYVNTNFPASSNNQVSTRLLAVKLFSAASKARQKAISLPVYKFFQ